MPIPRWVRWLLTTAAAALFGCSVPDLAGTNDAALEYAIDEATTSASPNAWLVAAAAKSRLASAQMVADVNATHEGSVRVIIDADAAAAADELLLWPGGLALYRLDDVYPLAPKNEADMRPVTATSGADGGNRKDVEDRGWRGTPAAVARLIREASLDSAHAILAERLGPDQARTHVVATPPLIASLRAAAEPVARGSALSVEFPVAARARLVAAREEDPQTRIALVLGSDLVATMPIDQTLATPSVVVPFGDDIKASARAHRTALLLRSPVLPPMHRVSAVRLPPRWGLAAACAVLPFALSFGWLFFVRRFDRARPEPMWLVVATFALGGLAIVPAAVVEKGLASLTPWLDPSLVTLGGQLRALPVSLVVFTLATGVVEEAGKWCAAWSLASHRREFDEPVDGIVYACAAALGFAAVENVKYFALGRMSGAVITVRAFFTVPAHMFFGAIWGYAMGCRLVSRRTRVLPFFALAALAHGAFDATLSTEGTQFAATMLVLVLAVAFVAMLRRALRYGAVASVRGRARVEGPPHTEPMPPSVLRRMYFRVGSPLAFHASATGMLGCAFALTLFGSAYEALYHRVGAFFVVVASGILALFALAAYAASETIPLDVAMDAQGVTFAGCRYPWGQIVGSSVEGTGRRAFVRMVLRQRVVRLGPAPIDTARVIAATIASGRDWPP